MARSRVVMALMLVICAALALPLVAAEEKGMDSTKFVNMFKKASHAEVKKIVDGLDVDTQNPEELVQAAVESKNLDALHAVLSSMNGEQFDPVMEVNNVGIYHKILADWYEQYHPIERHDTPLPPDTLTKMLEILQTLQENEGEPNMPTREYILNDLSPIHIATKLAIPEITTAILKQGADPNSVTPNGDTPMHLLAESLYEIEKAGLMDKEMVWAKYRDTAQALIDNGAILATANLADHEPHTIAKWFKKRHAKNATPDSHVGSFYEMLIPPVEEERREVVKERDLTTEELEAHVREYAKQAYGSEYVEPGEGESVYDKYGA